MLTTPPGDLGNRGLPRDSGCHGETHLRLQRAEVLAALGNALLLVGVAVWVRIKAVDRLSTPVEIDGGLMLVVAVVGVWRTWRDCWCSVPRRQEPEHARRLS